jgi:hypothetical protein
MIRTGCHEISFVQARLTKYSVKDEPCEFINGPHGFIKAPRGISLKSLPSGDTSSEQAMQTLDRWAQDCVENHACCTNSTASSLPKRVLEVTSTHFYLREHMSTRAKYACLSHCWGKEGPALKLNKATIAMLLQGWELGQLPQTFQDTVHVCLRLGIRFLWIDALCRFSEQMNSYTSLNLTRHTTGRH